MIAGFVYASAAHGARRSNDEERETYGDTFTDVHRPIASAATRAFNIKPAIGRGRGRSGRRGRKRKEKGTDARRYFASSVSLFVPSGGGGSGCLRMREFFFFFFSSLFNAIISPFPSNYARAWRLSGSSRNYFPD